MAPGNHGIGGVPVPPRHRHQSHPEVDPLTALSDDPDMHMRFRAAAEEVCGEAIERARGAEAKAAAIDGKLNLLLGIAGTTLAACLGAFVWLFQQQQVAESNALQMAQREAKTVVLESLLEEQSRVFAARKDPDRITPLQR